MTMQEMQNKNDAKSLHTPDRIDIGQTWEIRYWAKALDCTESKLKDAVSAVGSKIELIRVWLARDRHHEGRE